MSEWWTYSLSDFLLFSPRTYYRLFELYNLELWPAHILTLAMGFAILALWRGGGAGQSRLVALILSVCWLWVAWAFLLGRYDAINWAARYSAIGFAIEALLIAWSGLVRNRLWLRTTADAASVWGICILLFALAVQPLIGPLVGRSWLQVEVFGMTPDPTVTATLGVALAARRWGLLIIPLFWCAISGATLWVMQSPDAFVMPSLGLLVLVVMIWSAVKGPPARPAKH